jgi:hypothetical protein
LVSVENATEDDIDLLTRQLLSELRDTDIESAILAKESPAPSGSKSGEPVMIGSIAVAVLPTLLPKIVEFIQTWTMRGHGRIVKFKGKGIEFEGSPEDFQKLLATLGKQKKKGK